MRVARAGVSRTGCPMRGVTEVTRMKRIHCPAVPAFLCWGLEVFPYCQTRKANQDGLHLRHQCMARSALSGLVVQRPGARGSVYTPESGFWVPRPEGGRQRVTPPSCLPLCSECNSNRDSVLSYTSVRSNSSYLGSDEMGSGECRGFVLEKRGPCSEISCGFYFTMLYSVLQCFVLVHVVW